MNSGFLNLGSATPSPVPLGPLRPSLLRLSVTDRCNFRCRYCLPPEAAVNILPLESLSLSELGNLATWVSVHAGIERVKLTGGEPLIRKGIESLIERLARTEGIREVSMTTNGSLLSGTASTLKASGLSRVNVSLDSMDATRFSQFTQGGRLVDTLKGIDRALAVGLTPLKLNAVLHRSSWKEDVPLLLNYAATNHLELRFIELMRTGTERGWCDSEYVSIESVYSWLNERGRLVADPTPRGVPARGTKIYWQGKEVAAGWIAPRSRPFCNSCERLRLDSRGYLRRCLMDSSTLDLMSMFRTKGKSDIAGNFTAYMKEKSAPPLMDSPIPMSQIGG